MRIVTAAKDTILRTNRAVGARLILAVSAVLIGISLVLSVSMHINSEQLILASVHDSCMKMLNLQANAYQQIISSQQKATLMLYSNKYVTQMMKTDTLPLIDRLECFRQLRAMITANESIHSLYVLDHDAGYLSIVERNGYYRELDALSDRAALDMMLDDTAYPNMQPVYHALNIPGSINLPLPEATEEVSSFIIRVYNARSQISDAIMVNFYTSDYLLARYSELEILEHDYTMVDLSGQVVYSTEAGRAGLELSEMPAFAPMLSGNESGSYVSEPFGRLAIVTYLTVPNAGMFIFSITPYESVSGQFRVLARASVVITTACILFGLLLMAILARRLIAPITNFFRNLPLWINMPTGHQPGDIRQYQEFMERNRARMTSLEKFREQNQEYLADHYLRMLLEGESAPLPSGVELPVDPAAPCRMILICLGESADLAAFEVPGGYLCDPPACRRAVLELGDRRTLIIAQRAPGRTAEDFWLQVRSETAEWVAAERGGRQGMITAAISDEVDSPAGWQAAYGQALGLLEAKYIVGEGTLITRLPGAVPQDREALGALINELISGIEQGGAGRVEDTWRAIEIFLQELSSADARYAVLRLMQALFTCAQREGSRDDALSFDFAETDMRVTRAHTLYQALDILRDVVDMLVKDDGEDSASLSQRDFAAFARAYISEHIRDYNLSSASLAAELGVSTTYVNRLFYKEVGIPLAICIRDYRLEQARLKLITTKKPLEEILFEVGWENTKYFFSVFKKAHGETPTEYRRRHGYRSPKE